MITSEELIYLEDLCKLATPDPWEHEIDDNPPDIGIIHNGCMVASIHPHMNQNTIITTGEEFSHADAKFIVAARNYMSRLLAEIRHLRIEQAIDRAAVFSYLDRLGKNSEEDDLARYDAFATLLKRRRQW